MRKIISKEVVLGRIDKWFRLRNEMMKNVDNLHVKIQRGNNKTGINCWTVSLLPVIDCPNCDKCKWDCYDIKNDLWMPTVINDRCRNSAIHKADIKRFWSEIDQQIKANLVHELRINVGGDLTYEDLTYLYTLGKINSHTMIMFFTKNYDGINKFLDEFEFTDNVHPIMSCWEGMEINNPHNLPCSHVLYEDGRTTAPDFGAYFCKGNCSECAFVGEGCWSLKAGEHVIFKAH